MLFTSIDASLESPLDPHCLTINTRIGEPLLSSVMTIQKVMLAAFGEDVFCPAPEDLHATLVDWINPFVQYGLGRSVLLQTHLADWKAASRRVLGGFAPVQVHWTHVELRDTCLVVVGKDNGEFAAMRDALLATGLMPAENKQPPGDIHITAVCFRAPLLRAQVDWVLRQYSVDMHEIISAFRLVEAMAPRLGLHTDLLEIPLSHPA